jgi:hypothetical protein
VYVIKTQKVGGERIAAPEAKKEVKIEHVSNK